MHGRKFPSPPTSRLCNPRFLPRPSAPRLPLTAATPARDPAAGGLPCTCVAAACCLPYTVDSAAGHIPHARDLLVAKSPARACPSSDAEVALHPGGASTSPAWILAAATGGCRTSPHRTLHRRVTPRHLLNRVDFARAPPCPAACGSGWAPIQTSGATHAFPSSSPLATAASAGHLISNFMAGSPKRQGAGSSLAYIRQSTRCLHIDEFDLNFLGANLRRGPPLASQAPPISGAARINALPRSRRGFHKMRSPEVHHREIPEIAVACPEFECSSAAGPRPDPARFRPVASHVDHRRRSPPLHHLHGRRTKWDTALAPLTRWGTEAELLPPCTASAARPPAPPPIPGAGALTKLQRCMLFRSSVMCHYGVQFGTP